MIIVAKHHNFEIEIPCIQWHPSFTRMTGTPGEVEHVPSGLYLVLDDDVTDYLERICHDSIKDIIHDIECAEAQFDVFIPTEDNMPFKHYGTLLRTVPCGMIMSLKHTWNFGNI